MTRNALRMVARDGEAGRHGSSKPVGSLMFREEAWQEVARSLHLSLRQLQIVRGVFDDRIEYAIAADLGIARRTVHTHVERLHRKLGVADRAQLILRVVQEFLALTAVAGSLRSLCAQRVERRCPRRSRS